MEKQLKAQDGDGEMDLKLNKIKEEIQKNVEYIGNLYNTCKFGHDQYCLYYSMLGFSKRIVEALESIQENVKDDQPDCGWHKFKDKFPEDKKYIWVSSKDKKGFKILSIYQYHSCFSAYKDGDYYWTYVTLPESCYEG